MLRADDWRAVMAHSCYECYNIFHNTERMSAFVIAERVLIGQAASKRAL
jgi:hypothetical protein